MNQDETPRAIELEEQRITTAILAGVLPEEIVRIRRNTVRCYFPFRSGYFLRAFFCTVSHFFSQSDFFGLHSLLDPCIFLKINLWNKK